MKNSHSKGPKSTGLPWLGFFLWTYTPHLPAPPHSLAASMWLLGTRAGNAGHRKQTSVGCSSALRSEPWPSTAVINQKQQRGDCSRAQSRGMAGPAGCEHQEEQSCWLAQKCWSPNCVPTVSSLADQSWEHKTHPEKKKNHDTICPFSSFLFMSSSILPACPLAPACLGCNWKTSERNEKEKGVLQTTADSPPAERRHQETWSWCSGHRAGKYRAVTCAPQALLHIFRPCNNKNGKNCNSWAFQAGVLAAPWPRLPAPYLLIAATRTKFHTELCHLLTAEPQPIPESFWGATTCKSGVGWVFFCLFVSFGWGFLLLNGDILHIYKCNSPGCTAQVTRHWAGLRCQHAVISRLSRMCICSYRQAATYPWWPLDSFKK